MQKKRSAEVVVPDYQLSLAIGKEGQNARLAARLTGYKIDIKSESQAAEEAAKVSEEPEADEFEIEEDLFNEEIKDDFVEDAENTEEAVEDFDAEDIEEQEISAGDKMNRKIPTRKCIGCGELKERSISPDRKIKRGEISLDMTGKKNGRGAYICPDPQCLKQAFRKKDQIVLLRQEYRNRSMRH